MRVVILQDAKRPQLQDSHIFGRLDTIGEDVKDQGFLARVNPGLAQSVEGALDWK